jgi:plasmid maintenance system antidote protein VapI
MKHDSESAARAAEFSRRLKMTGLSITQFQRASGLSRNVIYNLSKGQRPSSDAQALQLEKAFAELKRPDGS